MFDRVSRREALRLGIGAGVAGLGAAGAAAGQEPTPEQADEDRVEPGPGEFVVDVLYDAQPEGLLTFDVSVSSPSATVTAVTPGIVRAVQEVDGGVGDSRVRARSFLPSGGPSEGTSRLFSVTFEGESDRVEGTVFSLTDVNNEPLDPTAVELQVREGPEAGVAVELVPALPTVAVDGTGTLEVRVARAANGVDAVDLAVESADPAIARLTDVTTVGSPTVDASGVSADGASGRLRAAGFGSFDSETVTLGRVTVAGEAAGSVDLGVSAANVVDDDSDVYTVGSATGATVTVTDRVGPVVVGDRPATDPDGDGVYEDVDGSGEFNIADVSQYLRTFDGEAVQSNPDAFDFDGSGSVNIADVSALLRQL
jgi:hypothetical protein